MIALVLGPFKGCAITPRCELAMRASLEQRVARLDKPSPSIDRGAEKDDA